MKRRWFLIGLALPVIGVSCQAIVGRAGGRQDRLAERAAESNGTVEIARNRQTLVVATAANYPPYEQVEGAVENPTIVGFDIDLAGLIAERLGRELSVIDLEFSALIPAVINDDVDMAMAALAPNRSRKQQVDFSDIYYRSRHALVSFDGYLRSRNLNYQTIGIRAGSVQARYADRLGEEYPNLTLTPYSTLEEMFEALDTGALEGALIEANVAKTYLQRYRDFQAQIMPSELPTGSAIALPKNSPLRSDINAALKDIKSSGEMERLILQWFS